MSHQSSLLPDEKSIRPPGRKKKAPKPISIWYRYMNRDSGLARAFGWGWGRWGRYSNYSVAIDVVNRLVTKHPSLWEFRIGKVKPVD